MSYNSGYVTDNTGAYINLDGIKKYIYSPLPVYTGNIKLYLDAGYTGSYPGSGPTISDMSGLGNNGTITNGIYDSVDGGGSFHFTGDTSTKSYINCGSDDSLGLTLCASGFTINMWVKFLDTEHWCWMGVGALDKGGYSISLESNQTQLSLNKNAVTTQVYSWTPQLNTWYNITMVQPFEDNVLYYINGLYLGSYTNNTDYSFTGALSDRNLYIGGYDNFWGKCFNGKISTIMLHGEVLSASNILANYNAYKYRF